MRIHILICLHLFLLLKSYNVSELEGLTESTAFIFVLSLYSFL